MMPKGIGKQISLFSGGLIAAIAGATFAVTSPSLRPVQAQNAGALTVQSDIQEANTETGVITARGNVRLNYPARNIQGTAAQVQYFSEERVIVLSGNVYVLQDGNSMRAERMIYKIDEGRFVATPAQQEQVEAIYLVPEDSGPGAGGPAIASPPSTPTINLPSSEP